jgi:hypothetical protein
MRVSAQRSRKRASKARAWFSECSLLTCSSIWRFSLRARAREHTKAKEAVSKRRLSCLALDAPALGFVLLLQLVAIVDGRRDRLLQLHGLVLGLWAAARSVNALVATRVKCSARERATRRAA